MLLCTYQVDEHFPLRTHCLKFSVIGWHGWNNCLKGVSVFETVVNMKTYKLHSTQKIMTQEPESYLYSTWMRNVGDIGTKQAKLHQDANLVKKRGRYQNMKERKV